MVFYEAYRFLVVCIFLKLLAIFVSCHRSFLPFLLVVFSLLLSAISEASRYFVGCLYAVVIGHLGSFSSTILEGFCYCRLSCKLLTVFVSRLGSLSLLFLLFCSRPFSCCFSQLLLLLTCFFWPFFSLLANLRSNGMFIDVNSTVEVRPNYGWYGNVFMSPTVLKTETKAYALPENILAPVTNIHSLAHYPPIFYVTVCLFY